MWKNMTWLAAEWRYYFEWRKLALAAKLEGVDTLPERNRPWGYTVKWVGVALIFPLAVVIASDLIWEAVSTSEKAAQVFTAFGIILLIATVVSWIIVAFVTMRDNGPSYIVVQHWKRQHGPKDHHIGV